MSITPLHPYGRQAGRCKICEREVGNLATHTRSCERARAEFDQPDLSLEEFWALERATAHVQSNVEPFENGVTDLDMARLLRALEAGTEVCQGGRAGWAAPTGSPLKRTGLAKTVNEAIRVGLVTAVTLRTAPSIVYVRVVPAPVHLLAEDGGPVCRPPQGLKRYRMVDNRDVVDCFSCLTEA